jgi:hypothetical protein
LHDSIEIFCPYSAAFDFLRRFISEHRGQLPLAASLDSIGLPARLRLERDVNVHLSERPHAAGDLRRGPDTVEITWEPADGGPYPHFSGTVRIKPSHGHSEFILDGTYEPPLGLAGKLFDAAVGHRIAEATAANLLASLRSSLEAQWFAFTVAHAFAQHEGNVRAASAEAPNMTSSFQELSGRVTFRVDGSYLGCCIVVDGTIAGTPLMTSGEHVIDHEFAQSLVKSLIKNLKLDREDPDPASKRK